MAINKEMFISLFKKKFPSDLLIWHKCSAVSANDPIDVWDQTILKRPFSGHFKSKYFCDI